MLQVHRCNDLSMIFHTFHAIRIGYAKSRKVATWRKREREKESKKKMERKDKEGRRYIWSRDEWLCGASGLHSRVSHMDDVYPLKLYLGYFGESWRENEIQKRGDLRGRLRGGKCGKPMYIKGKINGRNYWGHGAEAGKPVLPFRHFNDSGSNILNPLHRRERRKGHRNRTYSDSSPRNNQQRISDVSYRPPLPLPVIISFKYFNFSEFDIPIIRNLFTFFTPSKAPMENE